MDLYQINGFKKIAVSKFIEVYEDDEIICPYCSEFIDKSYNLGEFENKQTGYISIECNHCHKFSALKFFKN